MQIRQKSSSLKFFRKDILFDVCVLAVQLIILLFLALPNGLNTCIKFYTPNSLTGYKFNLFCSSTDAAKLLGYLDPASYFLGAQKFLYGWLKGNDAWFLGCWPPGFFLVESFFMKVLGINCPIIFCLLISAVILWSFALWSFYLTLTQWQSRLLSAILSLSLCFTQLFRYFFLGSGVILSESLSTALLVICFSLSARNVNRRRLQYCLAAGICLALAAYIRAQFEIFSLFLLSLMIALVIIRLLFSRSYRQMITTHSSKIFLTIPLHRLLLVAASAQIIMLPYRIYNYNQSATIAWVQLDYYWKNMWHSPAVIMKEHGSLALLGGLNVAAQTSPKLAAEIQNCVDKFGQNYFSDNFYKQAAIKTLIKNPIKWFTLKASYFPWAWFDSLYISKREVSQKENWFYALLFWPVFTLAIFHTCLSNRDPYSDNTVDYFFLSIILSQFICSIFGHFEPRYFYFPKIGSIISALCYTAMYCPFNRSTNPLRTFSGNIIASSNNQNKEDVAASLL